MPPKKKGSKSKGGPAGLVWRRPASPGHFTSERTPPPPEISVGESTPRVQKPRSAPIITPDWRPKLMKKLLEAELDGSVKYDVDPNILIPKLFPPESLKVSVTEVFLALKKRVRDNNPTFGEKNWWSKWLDLLQKPESMVKKNSNGEVIDFDDDEYDSDEDYIDASEELPVERPATREEQICFMFQSVCDAAAEEFPELAAIVARNWTGYFHSKPLVSDSTRMVRKPDMAALNEAIAITDFQNGGNRQRWLFIEVIGEDKAKQMSELKFLQKVAIDLYGKGYCILESQGNRRSVKAISMTGDLVRITEMDRGGVIHTSGFNIKTQPQLFLHALLGLTFAPAEYVGYDVHIEVIGKERYITVKGETFKILKTLWRTAMIRGRATICYLVEKDGKQYVIKDYWVVVGREPSELFFLEEMEKKNIQNVSRLHSWEDVMVLGRLDNTDNNRGVYAPLLNRQHRRIVFSNPGVPIYFFESLRELIQAIIDIVEAHLHMVEDAKILHQDISLYNILIQIGCFHENGLRKGLLIDFDYSKDLDPDSRGKEESEDAPDAVPESNNKAPVEEVREILTIPEMELQQSISAKFEEVLRIRGHRTGTHPFMANEILIHQSKEHKPHHDLESLFYVIIYLGVMSLGPKNYQKNEGNIPKFLRQWLYPESYTDLGVYKRGLISLSTEDFNRQVTDHFTTYMKPLIPCVMKMKAALQAEETTPITHKVWLDILRETLGSLAVHEQPFVPNIPKVLPSVRENHRDLHLRMMQATDHPPPTGYLSADPNILSAADEVLMVTPSNSGEIDLTDDTTVVEDEDDDGKDIKDSGTTGDNILGDIDMQKLTLADKETLGGNLAINKNSEAALPNDESKNNDETDVTDASEYDGNSDIRMEFPSIEGGADTTSTANAAAEIIAQMGELNISLTARASVSSANADVSASSGVQRRVMTRPSKLRKQLNTTPAASDARATASDTSSRGKGKVPQDMQSKVAASVSTSTTTIPNVKKSSRETSSTKPLATNSKGKSKPTETTSSSSHPADAHKSQTGEQRKVYPTRKSAQTNAPATKKASTKGTASGAAAAKGGPSKAGSSKKEGDSSDDSSEKHSGDTIRPSNTRGKSGRGKGPSSKQ